MRGARAQTNMGSKEGVNPSKKQKKKKEITIDSFCTGNEQRVNETEGEGSAKEKSEIPANWIQALEEIKMQFKTQLREAEDNWEKNLKTKISHLETEALELKQENGVLKAKINQLENEAKEMKDEVKNMKDEKKEMKDEVKRMKDDLQRKSDQKEKDDQKTKDEIQSLRTRIQQLESSDLTRQQDTIKQNQKNEKIEENMKHLIHKTEDLENRSRRDNLRIIGLPEDHDKRKRLDVILQEIIKENCPNILEQEGKVEIDRIHRSPPILNPQLTTPRNVIAKFKIYQTKEKILQAVKKSFRYHRTTVRITQDLAASTVKKRKAWNMIFRKARELGLQPRINYPAKLTIFLQEEVWSFNKIEEFQEFIKKRPDLNRKFDVQAQNSRESSKGQLVVRYRRRCAQLLNFPMEGKRIDGVFHPIFFLPTWAQTTNHVPVNFLLAGSMRWITFPTS
uniref:L1 transposable element RRM domain-containing protein n=1 Tax=Monodelphis domestica TaxID=13616 RepID=K7DZV7_MONDO